MTASEFLRRADWLGRDRIQAYSRITALALLPSLWIYYRRALGPLGSDFLSFWAAGKLVLAGAAAKAYDPAAHSAIQFALGRDHWFPFINPPPMLAVVAPLGLTTYPVALPLFVIATFAGWLWAVWKLLPGAVWVAAASPVAALAAWHAQSGFLTSALLIAGLAALPRRPFVAGLFFGALIVKPHIALLVPMALLAARQWRAIAGAMVSSLGLIAGTLLLFGPASYVAFFRSAGLSADLVQNGIGDVFVRMATPYAMLRVLGLSGLAAGAVQSLIAVACAAFVWSAWRSPRDPLEKGSILVVATCLATPYLFSYDLPMLIVPLAWLWVRGERRGFQDWGKLTLCLLHAAPLACLAAAEATGFNLTPFALVALFWAVAGREKGRRAGRTSAGQQATHA
jgi:hypothetical protein